MSMRVLGKFIVVFLLPIRFCLLSFAYSSVGRQARIARDMTKKRGVGDLQTPLSVVVFSVFFCFGSSRRYVFLQNFAALIAV